MNKEKHVWEKERTYFSYLGDNEYCKYIEYEICINCGVRRELKND